jgi:adenosylcobinamide kinase/adenosylcobinamide-phosphate guanylyltransferase
MYTLVLGGLRSGRSQYALKRASELGPPPWLYVSAGAETDEVIKRRLERHRKDKDAPWRIGALPRDPLALFTSRELEGLGALVLDGLSLWIGDRHQAGVDEGKILDEVGALADCLYRSRVPVVVVSTEINLPFWPENPERQAFAKILACANQALTDLAGSVVLMRSGVPVKVP